MFDGCLNLSLFFSHPCLYYKNFELDPLFQFNLDFLYSPSIKVTLNVSIYGQSNSCTMESNTILFRIFTIWILVRRHQNTTLTFWSYSGFSNWWWFVSRCVFVKLFKQGWHLNLHKQNLFIGRMFDQAMSLGLKPGSSLCDYYV